MYLGGNTVLNIIIVGCGKVGRVLTQQLVEGGDAQLLNHPELAAEVVKRAQGAIDVQKNV